MACQNSRLAVITSHSMPAEFITNFQLFLFIHAYWSILSFPGYAIAFNLMLYLETQGVGNH